MKLRNNNKNNNKKQEETERGGVGAPPGTYVRVQVLGPACSLLVPCVTPYSRGPLPLGRTRWQGRPPTPAERPSLPPPHWRPLASVVRDGETAEDGQAPAGIEAGGLGAAEAARAQGATQVAVAVRQRVRGTRGRIEHGGVGQAARQLEAEGRRRRCSGTGREGRTGRRWGLCGGHQAVLLLLLAAIVGGSGHRGEIVGLDGERRDEAAQLRAKSKGIIGARG